jgi:hypothetical protein
MVIFCDFQPFNWTTSKQRNHFFHRDREHTISIHTHIHCTSVRNPMFRTKMYVTISLHHPISQPIPTCNREVHQNKGELITVRIGYRKAMVVFYGREKGTNPILIPLNMMVVITKNQVDVSAVDTITKLRNPFKATEGPVTKMEKDVIYSNNGVDVLDHCIVHLIKRLERPGFVLTTPITHSLTDVCVKIVRIRGKEQTLVFKQLYFHSALI